jgi:hypothetical protein
MRKKYLQRKFVTIFLSATLSSFSLAVSAQTKQDLVPIQKFIASHPNTLKDPPSIQYLSLRCAGLYMSLIKMFSDVDDQSIKATVKDMEARSQRYFLIALNIEERLTKKSLDERTKSQQSQLFLIASSYIDRINQTRARTGNIWTDTLIKEDKEFCDKQN